MSRPRSLSNLPRFALHLSYFAPLVLLLAFCLPIPAAPPQVAKANQTAFFKNDVWPILEKNCITCHSGDAASGKLNLTTFAGATKGGVSGAAVVPGKPDASLLIQAIRYEGRQMPQSGKLPAAQIAILTRWVAMGATYAADVAPVAHKGPPPVNAETKRWWSFQPVRRPALPSVKNAAWCLKPLDRFVLAKLEANHLQPAPDAPRAQWIRRAYYDVTGLPPTPDEVAAFVTDHSLDAYAKVADRLLASPQYGERWGRHWLDLVRYAETNSFERDGDKPFVWRYRDYIIRAFNADKPYDMFIREQIAGDELPAVTPDSLIATGYYRLGQWDDEPADPELARFDDLDDILSTTGQTFLGLTVGCARCHDHKIDPIPQRDYYRMLAIFGNIRRYGVRSGESVAAASLRTISTPDEQARFAKERATFDARMAELSAQTKAIEDVAAPTFENVEKEEFRDEMKRAGILRKRVGKSLIQAQFEAWQSAFDARRELAAHPPRGLEMALCVSENGRTPAPMAIMQRGNAHAPGDAVTPGFLSILSPPEPRIAPPADGQRATSGSRLALADWLTSPQNPLPARVMANRLWQYHFGRGIVRTSSNFGFLGSAPTHPELLDYLASELVRGGWRLKAMHREILLSRTYRMASVPNPITATLARAKDPENDLLYRFDMRRLEAEEIRDSLLAVSGKLNPKMYGPSVLVKLPAEVLAGQSVPGSGWGESPKEEQARRSVYVKTKRSLLVPIFATHDGADTDATCPVRFATTQPTQALGMLNGAFVNEEARDLAELATRNGNSDTMRVRFVLRRVLQRGASAAETARGVRLLQEIRQKDGRSEAEALQAFCLVALNLNEFVYLD